MLGGVDVSRVGGAAGEIARETVDEWRRQSRDERARSIARVVAEVRAPVPAGAERVDRSWIEAALAGEDDRARPAWEARRTDPVGVWWCRRVTASWIALPAEDPDAEDIARWPAEKIVAAMRWITLAAIAHVTLEAGAPAVARLAASLLDGPILVEVARRLRDPDLRAGLGPVRAAAERVKAIDPRTDTTLGAATIVRALRGDTAAQLRLLLPIGLVLDGPALEVGWQTIRALV